MTVHVAIGASSWRDYQFLSPLSALLWRDLVGFHPIVLRAGNWELTDRGQIALAALRELNIEHIQIGMVEGYEEPTIAQNVRQHACMLLHNEDDWMMPSDADLWPVSRTYYYQVLEPGQRMVSLYSNGDHYQTLPTCHLIARVRDWLNTYGLQNDGCTKIEDAIKTSLDIWLANYRQHWPWTDRNMAVWMSDQAMMTDMFRAQPWFATECKMVERRGHPPVNRLDRGNWPPPGYDLRDFVDAHLFKAPDQDANWPKISELFHKLLPQYGAWADQYREKYKASYKGV